MIWAGTTSSFSEESAATSFNKQKQPSISPSFANPLSRRSSASTKTTPSSTKIDSSHKRSTSSQPKGNIRYCYGYIGCSSAIKNAPIRLKATCWFGTSLLLWPSCTFLLRSESFWPSDKAYGLRKRTVLWFMGSMSHAYCCCMPTW